MQFAIDLDRSQKPEPIQADERDGTLGVLKFSTQGPPRFLLSRQPHESEAPRREWWMVSLYGDGGELSRSPLHREEPQSALQLLRPP